MGLMFKLFLFFRVSIFSEGTAAPPPPAPLATCLSWWYTASIFKNYVQNRFLQVAINESLLDLLPVPQSSILCPLLFILFIDDICDEISVGSKIDLNANDTKIWREILCENDQIQLHHGIGRLSAWADRNLMKFHSAICESYSNEK